VKLTEKEERKVEEMGRDFVALSVEAKLKLLRFMMSHEIQVCESVEVSRTMTQ